MTAHGLLNLKPANSLIPSHKKRASNLSKPFFYASAYCGGFVLVVSLLAVSRAVLSVVVVVGVVDMVDFPAESVPVLSPLPLAARSELHPAATDAIIAVIKAKLKICFFIGFRY
jgi:hypothetical protein